MAVDADLQPPERAPPFRPTSGSGPRELKPALLELDGISRVSVEAHHRLYGGFVSQRNELLARLARLDRTGEALASCARLKVDLALAVGGIKNHEAYFEHLGGDGGDPTGAIAELIERDFGSTEAWRSDLRATGMAGARLGVDGVRLGRAAALQLRRRCQSSLPSWNATPLVALDVDEHAYFLDYRTDRAAYIDAVLREPGLGGRERWVAAYRDRAR